MFSQKGCCNTAGIVASSWPLEPEHIEPGGSCSDSEGFSPLSNAECQVASAQWVVSNLFGLNAMKYIGKLLSMPYINVYEIATFYSMYNLAPVGKYFIQVCTTSPCALRGANKLVDICKEKISIVTITVFTYRHFKI